MYKCTVYDAAGRELSPALSADAIVWEEEGNAVVLTYFDNATLRTIRKEYRVPESIVLKRVVRHSAKTDRPAPLSNYNLFVRDHFTCQYCGRPERDLDRRLNQKSGKPWEYLTRDHVVPCSLGGENTWTNCVTACNTCNGAKSNRTPESAKMPLRKRPHAPSVQEIRALVKDGRK